MRNAHEARAAVSMARYAPEGTRGITGGRTTGFGTIPLARYLGEANREVLAVLMIEDAEGLGNCEEIAGVPGIDWLLEDDYLYVKYLLRAGSLESKTDTGATDINKFYGKSAPNFLRRPA